MDLLLEAVVKTPWDTEQVLLVACIPVFHLHWLEMQVDAC